MQKLNSKLLQKVSTKPKYSSSENIIFYAFSFLACFVLLYALCYTISLIDTIIL